MTNRSSEAFRNTAAEIEREVSYAFININYLPYNIVQQPNVEVLKLLLYNFFAAGCNV